MGLGFQIIKVYAYFEEIVEKEHDTANNDLCYRLENLHSTLQRLMGDLKFEKTRVIDDSKFELVADG